ncbi:MAG: carbohydrate porin [Rhodoferax sp.]|nr:carbohydrate porin [Rhodoferax sp.]
MKIHASATFLAAIAACFSAGAQDGPVVFEGGYKFDLLSVVSGGLQRGGQPLGHLDLKLKTDLEKTWGWIGTTAFFNLIHDHGEKFNRDRVGSFNGVTNIEVPVDTERLFQAWIQREWQDGKYSLLAGLYPIDTEFQVLDTAALFVQPPYGPTSDLSSTRGPSIFNTSAFGVRGKWVSDDRSVYAQAALLDGIPGDPNRPKGTHIVFGANDGTMGIFEIGLRTQSSGPAKYAVGLWGYSSRVDDLVDVDANQNPVQRLSHGAYVLADANLWKNSNGSSLSGFFRYGVTDGDSTNFRSVVNAGLVVNAPFSGRPDDVLGLAYTHAALSDKHRADQEAAGRSPTAFESSWELTYRFKPAPWLAVQPLVQWHQYPGGDRSVGDATVVGVRTEVFF